MAVRGPLCSRLTQLTQKGTAMGETFTYKGTTVEVYGNSMMATYPCGHMVALDQAPSHKATRFGFYRGWWRCPYRLETC